MERAGFRHGTLAARAARQVVSRRPMPPSPERSKTVAADHFPWRWCAFWLLWFYEAFLYVMFIAWSPIAHATDWERAPSVPFIWILLALGVSVSASACATAWALALTDLVWVYPPRCPTSRSSRRAPKRARG